MTVRRNQGDRAFTNDVARFQKNIYQTAKGRIRQAVLHADLADLINSPKSLRVLDIGAGIGQVNQLFATSGHQVVHSDISAQMVEAACLAHHEAGLSSQYSYITAGLQQLPDALAATAADPQFDVVLCHAVLEWLAEPSRALALIKPLMKPRGWLSLMFYNKDAKAMANLLYGNFDYVKAGLKVKKKVRFSPHNPLTIQQVKGWSAAQNLTICQHSGVRCIHDYLREVGDQSRDDLIDMELGVRHEDPFRQLGRYQHFLLRASD